MWPTSPGAAWPTSSHPGQPPAGRPDAAWADVLPPVSDSSTDVLDRVQLAPAPGDSGPRRPRRPLALAIAAAAVVAVVAGLVIVRALSGSTARGTTGTVTPAATSSDTQRQAAVKLSALLAKSVADRAAVTGAAVDVRECGPDLPQDAQTFARAASARQNLLSQLADLPGRSAWPAAMLPDLTSAWQASAQVDTDLSQWAQDNITRGCRHGARSDAHLRASYVPEAQADASKRAFAAQWNPIARRYGLTTYQRNQL